MPQAGEIWLAEIRFTSGAASKLRPVLVLWQDAADVVVAAITKAAPRSPTDLPLQDWVSEGLAVASTVRLSRLDCLEQLLLRRRLGRISQRDALLIKTTWSQRMQLQF
jgi:PemK-like, MazF-like toxin of type II toxin-antitoxin system